MSDQLKENLVIAVAMFTLLAALLVAAQVELDVPSCQEDEDWMVVAYDDPRGSEDQHGVSRACIHIEEGSR